MSHRIKARLRDLFERHQVADPDRLDRFYDSERGYYPAAEAGEERDHFAICLASVDGQLYCEGDHELPFALQSISKVFAYALALDDNEREDVLAPWASSPAATRSTRSCSTSARAAVQPDGQRGRARDHRPGARRERRAEDRAAARRHAPCAGNDGLEVNQRTFEREFATPTATARPPTSCAPRGCCTATSRSCSRSTSTCSVLVTCAQLAVMAATLANGCVNPFTGDRALPRDRVRDVLSVMYTCGMYDAAGQWAYEVGVPAKSGVSGGILAVVPGKIGIGVFSPGLDVYGNSVRGVSVCHEIASHLGVHVFAAEDEDALLGSASPAD